jgi:ketosteroid isomerase-like protein
MGVPSSTTREAIVEEEAGLQDALFASDEQWFKEHWAPDASYVHMSGGYDDTASFIERLRSKATVYHARETGGTEMREYGGDTVVITGWSRIDIAVKGERKELDTRFTRVYVKDGDRWVLVANQSGAANNNPPLREGTASRA